MNKLPTESEEQISLFLWAELETYKYPELRLLYAIPNGGKRHITTAVRLKREGVKSGVPDTFLPIARGGFHGLYIEMKREKGRLSDNQIWWKDELEGQGYSVAVCYNWHQARDVIFGYLKL